MKTKAAVNWAYRHPSAANAAAEASKGRAAALQAGVDEVVLAMANLPSYRNQAFAVSVSGATDRDLQPARGRPVAGSCASDLWRRQAILARLKL